MAEKLKIWALREGHEVAAVESVTGVKLEDTLEETLVQRPEMLEAGLHLVGRQTPTDGGPSDLLGVDAGGRLVVYELKREKLTREAVTQCIDYASALDEMEPGELAKHIAERTGTKGIERIDDLEAWYANQFADNDASDLLPPRLVLVGLGVDERAERMARFLSEGGMDISVLTFYGFQRGGETLLARQVEVERDTSPAPRRHRLSAAEKQAILENALTQNDLAPLFGAVHETIRTTLPQASSRYLDAGGVSFKLPGRSTRFCSVFAGYLRAGALTISLPGKPEHYGKAALAALGKQVELQDWMHGGKAVTIDSQEDWVERRPAIVQFMKAASEAWNSLGRLPMSES